MNKYRYKKKDIESFFGQATDADLSCTWTKLLISMGDEVIDAHSKMLSLQDGEDAKNSRPPIIIHGEGTKITGALFLLTIYSP